MSDRIDKESFEQNINGFDLSDELEALFENLPNETRANADLSIDDDLLMEQILENMNTTPIGKVLKKIAEMPEVSRKKVLRVRRELTEGSYDLNDRLDLAMEKVLHDLDA